MIKYTKEQIDSIFLDAGSCNAIECSSCQYWNMQLALLTAENGCELSIQLFERTGHKPIMRRSLYDQVKYNTEMKEKMEKWKNLE